MKTEVIMERELLGGVIPQKSKSGFFSATDLMKLGNKWRVENGYELANIADYFRKNSTKEFMAELQKEFGEIKINSKGKNSKTWVHPLLFVDIALWISPKLKLKVYQWLSDELLKYRNDSGDSYKLFVGSVDKLTSNKAFLSKNIQKCANRIRESLSVTDWNCATEEQLEKRDDIHRAVALLSDVVRNLDQVMDIAISKIAK